MAKYRKVETRIWNDAKFRSLSDRAQLVFFFLLTHPHLTPLGAMRATVEGLAAELNHWPAKAFREAFAEALAKGMAEHDPDACFVALPHFLKYNAPESPNVIRSWVKCWDDIPECELKVQLGQRVKGFAEGLSKGFAKAFAEAFPKGMANQEQEQEQDITPLKPPTGGEGRRTRFQPPTVDEVAAYCQERGNGLDAQQFVDFYQSKGWMVGSNRMKDWKAAVRTWEKNAREQAPVASSKPVTGPKPLTDDQVAEINRIGITAWRAKHEQD